MSQRIATDFSEIKEDFCRLFKKVSDQEFKAKVNVLGEPIVYRYVEDRTAMFSRNRFGWPNKIWIKELPIHVMFYELAYVAGASVKPILKNKSLCAEHMKAALFQTLFSLKVFEAGFDWLEEYLGYESDRRAHIKRNYPDYARIYDLARVVSGITEYDFKKGLHFITSTLEESLKYDRVSMSDYHCV